MQLKKYIITEGAFFRKVLALMIPVLLQSLISQGVNAMDTVMVGQLGEIAISGSSIANQFYIIFTYVILGVCAAGTVLITQYFGAEEYGTIRHVLDMMLQMGITIALVFAAVALLIPEKVLHLYTTDEAVIAEGAGYLRIMGCVYIPHAVSLIIVVALRAVGNAKLALFSILCSFAVNIGCNYVFIFGKLGFPAMGILGAALGTLCARVVEVAACGLYILKFEKVLKYRFREIFKLPNSGLIREFFRLGLPAFISDSLCAVGITGISMVIGHMGRTVISAYSIVNVIDSLCFVGSASMGGAAGFFIGQSVGGNHIERAKKEAWTLVLISMALGVISGLLLVFAGKYGAALYNVEPETLETAQRMICVSASISVFTAVQMTLGKGVLRCGGDTRFMLIADVLFQFCLSIPLGYLTGIIFGWPAWLVFFCLKSDLVVKAIWLVLRLKSGKWIHRAREVKV